VLEAPPAVSLPVVELRGSSSRQSRPASTRPPATPSGSRVPSTNARTTSPLKPSLSAASAVSVPATPPRKVATASVDPSPSRPDVRKASISAATGAAPARTVQRPPSVAETTRSSRAPTPAQDGRADLDSRAMPPPPIPSVRVASPVTERPSQQRSLSSVLSPSLPVSEVARPPSPDKESTAAAFALKRELEECRIKVRILETRRSEDQERIKGLESKAGEADALRAARVKLQGELGPSIGAPIAHVQPNFKNSRPPYYPTSGR
jgi:dynactin 1